MNDKIKKNTPETLMDLFQELMSSEKYIYAEQGVANEPFVRNFDDVNVEKLEKIFNSNGKPYFFSDAMKAFFSGNDKMWRCQHSFSVYLLGIICYERIPSLKECFKSIFTDAFYRKTGEADSQNTDKKRFYSFLYLWYPTALYHDMGYIYEDKDIPVDETDPQKEEIETLSEHIINKEITNDDYLGIMEKEYRTPQKLWKMVGSYLKTRLETTNLSHRNKRCIDHGFASGLCLYKHMRNVHYKYAPNADSAVSVGRLSYSQKYLKYYNAMSAWAITCHNIRIEEKGTKAADKFSENGFRSLTFPKGHSFITVKDNPLLFLLDFIDTIDPVKRFGVNSLYHFEILNFKDNEMKIHIAGCNGGCCLYANTILRKISSDLDFLKSDTFRVEVDEGDNSITFSFGQAPH